MAGMRLYAPLVATAIAVAGCSMARFGYEVLPTWIHWQAERHLDLDEEQRAIVGRRVEELHQWHQRTQLPRYAGFLREVESKVGAGVDADDLARWRDRVAEAWEPVADRMAPGVAELALTLRPAQIERLRQRLDESAAKSREKMLPEGESARSRARLERIVDRAEFFLGGLGRAQLRELKPVVDALPAVEEDWIAEREARNRRLVALLHRIVRDKPSKAEATRMCREFLVSMWLPSEARRRHRIERGIAAGDALSAQMLAGSTPKQREHLAKLLQKFSGDFDALAARATPGPRADAR